MKVITIDDFSGGKNLWDSQVLIPQNECASGTVNAWAPQRALTKMPGATELLTLSATSSAGLTWIYADDSITTAFSLYLRVTSATSTANAYPWAGETNSLTPLGYVTGTCSISGASLISATGSGTTWSTHVSANDLFRVDSSASKWYKVVSVEDSTHLTLDGALPVSVATGSAYTILPGLGPGKAVASGQTGGQMVANASLNGSIMTSNLDSIMQQYDSTGMTRISAAPKAAYLQTFKNYLFAARTFTAESRLYWSDIKAPTAWTSTNFIDIEKDKGKISGIFAFGNELIIFKTRAMFKLVGEIFDSANPTYSVSAIAVPSGFQFNSPYTCAVHKDRLLFYSRRALYAYQHGTSRIERISKKFTNDLSNQYTADDLLGAFESIISAVSINGYYVIAGMSDSSTDCTLGILDENGAWWAARAGAGENRGLFGGSAEAFPMCVIKPATLAKPRLLLMSGLATNFGVNAGLQGRVYVYDIMGPTYEANYKKMSDGSSIAIKTTWLSKEFNISYGTFKHIVMYLKKQSAGNIALAWSIDQGSFVSNTVSMTTGRGNVIRKVLDINQRGSTIQIRLVQDTVGQTFEIYGIEIFYEPDHENRLV